MNVYEFMSQNPYLTVTLFVIGAATFSQCIKYLAGYQEQKDEQEN
ncbi:hypothetical protein [Streptococcus pluranimalium]|nr:hypothetical protein [Streptococcus pluranimalium]